MAKLDEQYDSKSTPNRTLKIFELMSIKYTSICEDISQQIAHLAGILVQLQGMCFCSKRDDTLSVSILVASIQVSELGPETAAIRTLAEADLKGESVSSLLIEERQTLTSGTVRDRAAAASYANLCDLFSGPRHRTEVYFFNPLNPNNKLELWTTKHSASEIQEKRRNGIKTSPIKTSPIIII